MINRPSRFGIGPLITASALGSAMVAGAATYLWPDVCLLPESLRGPFRIAGAILLLVGIPAWLIAVVSVMRAYNGDRLVTSGIFAIVRHPMYAAWIVLNVPGLALLSRSWPLLLTSLAPYVAFRLLVHREDDYLERRFGTEYLAYRARVNALIPIPRFRHRAAQPGSQRSAVTRSARSS